LGIDIVLRARKARQSHKEERKTGFDHGAG
jgi:hypothetical protein